MTAELLSSALVGHSSAASGLRWDSEASSYVGRSCRPSPWPQCREPFSIGNDPPCSAESRRTLLPEGAIYFGRLSTSRAPGLKDVVFLPEKAETEDLAELL